MHQALVRSSSFRGIPFCRRKHLFVKQVAKAIGRENAIRRSFWISGELCLPLYAVAAFSDLHFSRMYRSHHCAQLTLSDLGATVSLVGWVDSLRDHGGILFIDLRDRKGVTQVKFDPHANAELTKQAAHLKPESVVLVS